jgi:hypothetical protein
MNRTLDDLFRAALESGERVQILLCKSYGYIRPMLYGMIDYLESEDVDTKKKSRDGAPGGPGVAFQEGGVSA